jgi:hypothetical protein
VVVVARPMQLESGSLKLLTMWVVKMAVDFPHTQECTRNSTKQYVGLASANYVVLRP